VLCRVEDYPDKPKTKSYAETPEKDKESIFIRKN
jgi:hypothetical protein